MRIVERLESVRQAFHACEMVVYADISTNAVLSKSGTLPMQQEHLNALCLKASDMLDGAGVAAIGNVLKHPSSQQDAIYQVIVADAEEVGIFLRSAAQPSEVLCCICTPSIDLPSFISAARDQLEQIGLER